MCAVSRTLAFTPLDVIRLTFPSSPSVKFHLPVSEWPVIMSFGLVSVGVALSELVEDEVLEWIPVDGRVWAVRLRDLCTVNTYCSDRRSVHAYRLES